MPAKMEVMALTIEPIRSVMELVTDGILKVPIDRDVDFCAMSFGLSLRGLEMQDLKCLDGLENCVAHSYTFLCETEYYAPANR